MNRSSFSAFSALLHTRFFQRHPVDPVKCTYNVCVVWCVISMYFEHIHVCYFSLFSCIFQENQAEENGPSDLYAAISSVDKEAGEPEKIKTWREEQKTMLTSKGRYPAVVLIYCTNVLVVIIEARSRKLAAKGSS